MTSCYSLFSSFVVYFCLIQCSNGNFVYPRPIPNRSSFGHGVYRRSRNREVLPHRQSASDLWEYDNFKDVVAAVVSRLKSSNTSASSDDDVLKVTTDISEEKSSAWKSVNDYSAVHTFTAPPLHSKIHDPSDATSPAFNTSIKTSDTRDGNSPFVTESALVKEHRSIESPTGKSGKFPAHSSDNESPRTNKYSFMDHMVRDSSTDVGRSVAPAFEKNSPGNVAPGVRSENSTVNFATRSEIHKTSHTIFNDNEQSVPNRPFTGLAEVSILPKQHETTVASETTTAHNPKVFPNRKSSNFNEEINLTGINISDTQDDGSENLRSVTSNNTGTSTLNFLHTVSTENNNTVYKNTFTPTLPYPSSGMQTQDGDEFTSRDLPLSGDLFPEVRSPVTVTHNVNLPSTKYLQQNGSSYNTSEQQTYHLPTPVTEIYKNRILDKKESQLLNENSRLSITKLPSADEFTDQMQTITTNRPEIEDASDYTDSTHSLTVTTKRKKSQLHFSTRPFIQEDAPAATTTTTAEIANLESIILNSSKRNKNDFAQSSKPENHSILSSTTSFNFNFSVTTPVPYRKRNQKAKPTPKYSVSNATQVQNINENVSSVKSTPLYHFSTQSSRRNKQVSTSPSPIANDTFVNRSKQKPLHDAVNYRNASRSTHTVQKNETRQKTWTTTTTTTTSYPPQNDVPWNTEHRNIPMSDSEEDDEIIVKIKPRYDEDPYIEPPEPFAEPGPKWKKAKKEWGIAWEVHIYITGPLFAALATYSGISVVRLLMMPNLHSKCYFICLNFMMLLMGVTRAIYLMHDSYNSNYSYPAVLSYFLYNISNPCLTSSFAILFLALLQATKLRLLSPKIQKPVILAAIIAFHFGFSTTTDIIVGSLLGTTVLLFICHLISVVWALTLAIAYFYIFRKLHKAAIRKQGELIRITFTRLHIDGGDLPKHLPKARLGLAVKMTLATAIFGFLMSIAQLYGMVYVFEYFSLDHPDPWPWWGFHFTCRILELAMYVTMTFIATQPVRHFEADSNPACVSTSWHPCNVFVGFGCTRKDPMVAYSSSCLAHHSFRNPGFSSTLDTPRRNWEQTNFQPSLQAATLERKDLSLVTEDHKPQNESLLSLCSIKKSVISVEVDTNDVKKSCSTLNLENQVNSLARSTKSEKTSMLYKENGFIRFRTDNDPEQPMEDSDCDDEARDDATDDRFSTMATAGSAVQSIADEDQLQKAVSQFYSTGYWSPRAKRLSRSSMDTTVESGMNTSVECLNNLVIARAGISNSAQEFSMYRYGSTCSSESAGNSFDVYLHNSSRSPRQNGSSSNLNGVAKRRMRNSTSGSVQYRESFISSSDNDAGDNNDLTSEDCATRSLLSQGDIDETISKNDETESLSPCCQCNVDSSSFPNRCADCKPLIPLSNSNFCDDASVRESYLNSIIPMVIANKETTSSSAASLKANASTATFIKERTPVFPKIDENISGKNCGLKNSSSFVPGTNSETEKPRTNGECAKVFEPPKQVRRFQKASKSQSVDDLTKSSTYWDPSIRTKKQSRTLWQKLRGSTFSLNTNLLGYELLTANVSGEAPKRSGSDVVVQRSASDRRPRATSTMKNSGRSYEHINSFCDDKNEVAQKFAEGTDPRRLLEKGCEVVLVLDSDNCSQMSDVSV